MGIFDRFGKDKPGKEVSPGGSVIHRYSSDQWAQTQVGFIEKAGEYGKLRDSIYERRFGQPKLVWHEPIPLIPHIDVMEYYRTSENGEVCVLATSGMSNLPMRIPPNAEAPRRVEIIFYCTEPKREYIETMRWLAHFPHDQKSWIGAFHTVPNGNPPEPLWGTAMDTLFFLPPIVRKDTTLREDLILDDDPVEFLWLVPLTSAECKLKLAKGSKAILDLFQSHKHPHIFDPARKSYV